MYTVTSFCLTISEAYFNSTLDVQNTTTSYSALQFFFIHTTKSIILCIILVSIFFFSFIQTKIPISENVLTQILQ